MSTVACTGFTGFALSY